MNIILFVMHEYNFLVLYIYLYISIIFIDNTCNKGLINLELINVHGYH